MPSNIVLKSIDTLDPSGIRMVLEKEAGDFDYQYGRLRLTVGNITKYFPVDVSGGQIVASNGQLIGDNSKGDLELVVQKGDFGLQDGSKFQLISSLEGKNETDPSGNPIPSASWKLGNVSYSSQLMVDYPLASGPFTITEVKPSGNQVVSITLDQPLNNYFDSSAGLLTAEVVDASNTSVKDFSAELKQQIDLSGSQSTINVELTTTQLSGSYGKALKMKLSAKETNGGSTNNDFEKSTEYTVEDCKPVDTATNVSLTQSQTGLSSTLTWAASPDASGNADRLTYIVSAVHLANTTYKKVTTFDPSNNQVATISNLTAGVKYESSYEYMKARPTTAPYPSLVEEYIIGTTQTIGSSTFFAHGVPRLTSVTYAFPENDCSKNEFQNLLIEGNAEGHYIKQFYVLANGNDATDVVQYKLVDASGLTDICGNSLNVDGSANKAAAATEFKLRVDMGQPLNVALDKQMTFVAMDTNTTIDPVKFQQASDSKAANYAKNFANVNKAIDKLYSFAITTYTSDFQSISGAIDGSVNRLNTVLVDASGKIQGLAAYEAKVTDAGQKYNAFVAADASYSKAFNDHKAAVAAYNDYSNNFVVQAKAKTAELLAAKDASGQSHSGGLITAKAYNDWNNLVYPVNRQINGRTLYVDASGKASYTYDGTTTEVTVSLVNVNGVDALFNKVLAALSAAKTNTAQLKNTTANADETTWQALQTAIVARNNAYATYKTNYDTYANIVNQLVNKINTWNNGSQSRVDMLTIVNNEYNTAFAAWKASKDAYGCHNYYYGLNKSEAVIANALALKDNAATTLKLTQSVPVTPALITRSDSYENMENPVLN